MPSLRSLFRNLLRRDRRERDLDDELRAYVEMAADEKCRLGVPESEARRAALLQVGGLDRVKEGVRDVWAGATVDAIRQDVLYGARMLAKNRAFTAVAVATLALGIGANTAIFSVVDTVVFRPLPYEEPDRLVKICSGAGPSCADDLSLPELREVREQSRVFAAVAADDFGDLGLLGADGSPQRVSAARVTANWLAALGTPPILGRGFQADEERAGHDGVAILTHDAWKRRFAGATDVVGRVLTTQKGPVTVVGVLPPNVLRYEAEVLRPLVESEYPSEWSHRDLDVFARLRPGVTLAEARAETEVIGGRLDSIRGGKPRGLRVEPLGKYYAFLTTQARKADRTLVLLLGAVGLVLFIAGANVAGLLLARAVLRHRECVIRSALGASRGRLVRQLVIESLLLFVLGGAAGLALAAVSVRSIAALAAAGGYLPGNMAVSLDGRVLAFSLLVSLAAGLVFGVVPAVRASRVNLSDALRESTPGAAGGARRGRARRLLVVAELAMAIVLLVGFGLLTRTVHLLHTVPPGFDLRDMVVTAADAPGAGFAAQVAFWRDALERARTAPDVEAVAVTSRPPLHGVRSIGFAVEGRPAPAEGQAPLADDVFVDPGYFAVMKIPVRQGRGFRDIDNESAPRVAIVSASLARRVFGARDPIGERLRIDPSPRSCCLGDVGGGAAWEIVGVVGDVRQGSLVQDPGAAVYRPYSQILEHDMFLVARARSPQGMARLTSTSGLAAHLGGSQWSRVDTMRRIARESAALRLRRFVLILLGLFAALALTLAAVGVYGVMAHSVAERTREIGIRVALGATRTRVVREILAEAGRLALAGLLIGAAAAQFLTQHLSGLLFGVTPTDAATYLAVSLILAAVALVASYLPARRATRVDPMVALRQE